MAMAHRRIGTGPVRVVVPPRLVRHLRPLGLRPRPLGPPRVLLRQACYPNCRVQPLPGAGHYPPHDAPVALATEVEAFLRAR
nr:hypothetical protein OG409_09760 [Streptomyces sp. NBC_00974]